MLMKNRRQRWLPFFLFLFFVGLSFLALAASDDEIASQTGLDPDLFSVLTVDVDGTELAILFVFITERTFNSRISPELRQSLFPYVGQNALYVNPTVKQVVERFDFDPAQCVIGQEGAASFIPAQGDWIEITEGFLDGIFHVNPMGASYGSGSAGVLVLEDHIDPARPFWISYRGMTARFEFLYPMGILTPTPVVPPPSPASPPSPTTPVAPEVSGEIDLTALEELFKDGHFDAERVAAALNLSPDLIGSMSLHFRSGELTLLLIQLENEVEGAALDSNLLQTLRPLFGSGAVLVWAVTPTGAVFSPYYFWVSQAGQNYFFISNASLLELTPEFARKDHELAPEEVTAGVLLLPDAVNSHAAFTVYYGSVGVTFPGNPLP
jgi:hypothetical protein